ncbi:Uncharacterised protein [Yersinia enterocolitica]|nr:Uncharacterised protein [Yersinia enterocolitica]
MGVRGFYNEQLAAESNGTATDQGFACLDAGGIDLMTGFHVVATIEYQICRRDSFG